MNNLSKIRAAMAAEGLDALLLTSEVNRQYAAGYNISEGLAVVTQDGARYMTDSRYIEDAENNLDGFEVQMIGKGVSYNDLLQSAMSDFGVRKLGYEENFISVAELKGYQQVLTAELSDCQNLFTKLRGSKTPEEIAIMKKAQDVTDAAFADILNVIKPGMSELELMAELVYRLLKHGGLKMSFDPIVVSGPNTSMPHGVPGQRKLQAGDFITMDFGVKVGGYCSDMTRTVALGYATDEMKKVYQTVLDAQLAGIAATKAGVPGCDIDAAARKVITDAGYGDYFGHGYGHSLGLQIHEAPNCNAANKEPMPAFAVCSAEPGIYLPGKFGVRIEDVVIVTEDGCENITHSPKELIIL